MRTRTYFTVFSPTVFKRIILLAVLFTCWLPAAKAQDDEPGVAPPMPEERPRSGSISGKVMDATNNQPVEFATVALFARRDSSLVTGGVTDEQGNFRLEPVSPGAYRIKISFIGYRTSTKDTLVISARAPQRNLGTIRLRSASQTLNEVVVTAEQPVFQQSIDKRVFNVEQSIVTQGGSATDVLETVPSLAVDIDGNLTLRGSGGVIVLIDGKPSTLTGADRSAILEQIPASAIESVEVITNPSSKYDAEGMSGIINIVLKKNKLQGFNGQASVSAGTRDKYNGSVNLSYRTNKFNLYTNLSYRNDNRFFRGTTNRLNTAGDMIRYLDQNTYALNKNVNSLIQLGMDYYLTQRATLGFSARYSDNRGAQNQEIRYENRNQERILDGLSYRNNRNDSKGYNAELNLNYRQTFEQEGRELTASATYSGANNDNQNRFNQQIYNPDGSPSEENPILQNNLRDVRNSVTTLQADYIHPVGPNSKLETGLKSIIRQIDNDFVFEDYRFEQGAFVNNPLYSNRFLYNEQVHSVYGIFNSTIKNFGYQVGARLEQTLTESEQRTTDEKYPFNYLNFFPSVFLSYKLKNEQQLQLNYSRRINRPSIWQLNPFVDVSDTLNIRFGNPRLRPELTNSFELSYLKGWEKVFLTSSVYYRHSTDEQERFVTVDPNNVSTTTFINLGYEDFYGLELIARTTVTSWWNLTTTFNFFRKAIGGNIQQTDFNTSNTTWSAALISNMNIPKVAQVQITGNYRGAQVEVQGIRRPVYGINIGIKRDVLKNKGTVSLNVSDVFNVREFNSETNGRDFSQVFYRKRESQIATLTFTYKFGRFNDPEKRRSRNNGNNEDRGGEEDMF